MTNSLNNPTDLKSAVNEFGSSASREFHNFLEDIDDLVKQTTSLTGDELTRAKAKLSARVASARQTASSMAHDVAGRAKKGAKATDRYVHEQPWKVIGAGAAIAFLVGFALARRN